MKLEAEGGSAFDEGVSLQVDPFRVSSGYHRIAMDVMSALTGAKPAKIVINTLNQGAMPSLPDDDVVEIASDISRNAIVPYPRRHCRMPWRASCYRSRLMSALPLRRR